MAASKDTMSNDDLAQHESGGGRTPFYIAGIVVGLGIAAYIYLVAFDSLSETTLVSLTSVWVFPLVFGIYGFLAEKFVKMIDAGRADSLRTATLVWTRVTGFLGLILLLPFLFTKSRSPLLVAIVGSLFWAVLLFIFFQVVFPML